MDQVDFVKVACPCCGYQTLDSNADYDICRVCWWEDDGQDSHNAHLVLGGPNDNLSLLRARVNFILFGIYDPKRKDLLEKRDDRNSYKQLRKFIFDKKSETVSEEGTDWSAALSEEISDL